MKLGLPPKSRIEGFSDGVFAIIVTLLVLELRIPAFGEHASHSDYLQGLMAMGPKFLAYISSFIIVAIIWVNHHRILHPLQESNQSVLWLNNLLLFWASFIPFPTALLGEHFHAPVPVMFYGLVLGLCSISFTLLENQILKVSPGTSSLNKERKSVFIKNSSSASIYFIGAALAFASTYLSLACYALVPIRYFWPKYERK